MPRNVEVKIRLANPESVRDRLRETGAQDHGLLRQTDTYFQTPPDSGMRLKLREQEPGGSELIAYGRPDVSGLRTSRYRIFRLAEATGLVETLTLALGRGGQVRKTRHLFMSGRTRVHLDDVANLGSFLELEVVLKDDEPERDGEAEAEGLLRNLGLGDAPRIAGSYADMSATGGNTVP